MNRKPGIYVRSDDKENLTAGSSSKSTNFRFKNITVRRPFDNLTNIKTENPLPSVSTIRESKLPSGASPVLDTSQLRKPMKRACNVKNSPGVYQVNRDDEDDFAMADLTDSDEDPEFELPKKHVSSSSDSNDDFQTPTIPIKKKKKVRNSFTKIPAQKPHNLESIDTHRNHTEGPSSVLDKIEITLGSSAKEPTNQTLSEAEPNDEPLPQALPTYQPSNINLNKAQGGTSCVPGSRQPVKKCTKFQSTLNPLGLVVRDDNGNVLKPGTKEYLKQYGKLNKRSVGTLNKYYQQYGRLKAFIKVNVDDGEEKCKQIDDGTIPKEDLSVLLATYFSAVKNSKNGKPLDTTTLEKVWSSLCCVIKEKTGYEMQNDDDFKLAQDTKGSAMRLSKREPGLGQYANRSIPISAEQLKFILASDVVSVWTPRSLTTLLYILLMVYFLPRAVEEALNLTRGDLRRVFNSVGECIGILYDPQGTTKTDRGDVVGREVALTQKR